MKFTIEFDSDELWAEIVSRIKSIEIEHGSFHLAEKPMQYLLNHDKDVTLGKLKKLLDEFIVDDTRFFRAQTLVCCIGRNHELFPEAYALEAAERALGHKSVEVREAGVLCIEHMATPGAKSLLQAYANKEPVEWLAKYIRNLIYHLEL